MKKIEVCLIVTLFFMLVLAGCGNNSIGDLEPEINYIDIKFSDIDLKIGEDWRKEIDGSSIVYYVSPTTSTEGVLRMTNIQNMGRYDATDENKVNEAFQVGIDSILGIGINTVERDRKYYKIDKFFAVKLLYDYIDDMPFSFETIMIATDYNIVILWFYVPTAKYEIKEDMINTVIESIKYNPDAIEPIKELTYGDTFIFDDLEITFNSSVEWDWVENRFSDWNGYDTIKFPVTIKNIKNETHGLSFLRYNFFNPTGLKAEIVGSYFGDDVRNAGDMRSGAIQETYIHVIYDGDGDYYAEFSTGNTKIEVKLPVKK